MESLTNNHDPEVINAPDAIRSTNCWDSHSLMVDINERLDSTSPPSQLDLCETLGASSNLPLVVKKAVRYWFSPRIRSKEDVVRYINDVCRHNGFKISTLSNSKQGLDRRAQLVCSRGIIARAPRGKSQSVQTTTTRPITVEEKCPFSVTVYECRKSNRWYIRKYGNGSRTHCGHCKLLPEQVGIRRFQKLTEREGEGWCATAMTPSSITIEQLNQKLCDKIGDGVDDNFSNNNDELFAETRIGQNAYFGSLGGVDNGLSNMNGISNINIEQNRYLFGLGGLGGGLGVEQQQQRLFRQRQQQQQEQQQRQQALLQQHLQLQLQQQLQQQQLQHEYQLQQLLQHQRRQQHQQRQQRQQLQQQQPPLFTHADSLLLNEADLLPPIAADAQNILPFEQLLLPQQVGFSHIPNLTDRADDKISNDNDVSRFLSLKDDSEADLCPSFDGRKRDLDGRNNDDVDYKDSNSNDVDEEKDKAQEQSFIDDYAMLRPTMASLYDDSSTTIENESMLPKPESVTSGNQFRTKIETGLNVACREDNTKKHPALTKHGLDNPPPDDVISKKPRTGFP